MREIAAVFFMAQCLAASAVFGTSLRHAHANSGYFGKQYIPSWLQIVMPAWLIVSTFINIIFTAIL